jgi:3-hydroxyacyl-[acyl-carrier-protein] dehydratase
MRFILVDNIIEMAPGRTIYATKTLSAHEDVFIDHFPGFPVVPGVLLTEMMAQAAGRCLEAADKGRGKAMLLQVRKASFRRWVRPDERADIHADITSSADAYATAVCRITVGGEEVASADLLFSFLPWSSLSSDFRDEVLERFLGVSFPGDSE